MAKKKKSAKKRVKKTIQPKQFVHPVETRQKSDKTLSIVGLIVNILILPGLGSIIGGKTKTGIWQLVIFLIGMCLVFIGIPLSFILIGIPILILGGCLTFAVWVWGIVTGVQMIQESA